METDRGCADGLERRAQTLLDFERDWPAYEGRKVAAIRARFGFSASRYYELLNRIIDLPAARAYDPLTVGRLRRRRDERERQRTARQLAERTRGR